MTRWPTLLRALLAASLLCTSLLARTAHAADPGGDAASIKHVMMATFDKPEARLAVEPVVVVGDHAVAGWAQGERGGRALLAKHHQQWQITLCAGDGLKDAKLLKEAGLSAKDADAMVKALASAEAKLPATLLAKFSTFDGLVRMDAHGQHPPQHGKH